MKNLYSDYIEEVTKRVNKELGTNYSYDTIDKCVKSMFLTLKKVLDKVTKQTVCIPHFGDFMRNKKMNTTNSIVRESILDD